MPLSSVADAEDWVRSHSVRKPRACIGNGSAPVAPSPPPKANPPVDVDGGEFEKILAEVHKSRAQAFKNLEDAQLQNDGLRTGIASKHFSDAVNTALKTEQWVAEQLKERGELVSMSLVRSLVNKTLAPLVAALDGVAATIAQRCNPAAPLLAETTIREWVNDTKGLIQSVHAQLLQVQPAPA